MGAGKTAVLGEASDILAQRQIIHAAIDLDALGVAHLPSETRARVPVWPRAEKTYPRRWPDPPGARAARLP